MSDVWSDLYRSVLHGLEQKPRGRATLERTNVQYKTHELEHIDVSRGRSMSLDYLKREFLWYCLGDRYDTRIQEYAPLWKSCVGRDGGINSNYGQYLFTERPGFDVPFFNQLDEIIADNDSRRCWIPIWSGWHTNKGMEHPEVPCTIGMGFMLRDTMLHMSVHMRSQDLWHGTPYDEGTAYLFQLMAVAYLNWHGTFCQPGTITHTVDSLHLYERHWSKAQNAVYDRYPLDSHERFRMNCYNRGFTVHDLHYLRRVQSSGMRPSDLLLEVMDFKGAYSAEEWL